MRLNPISNARKKKKLLINLSFLGSQKNGFNSYSRRVSKILYDNFDSTVLCNVHFKTSDSNGHYLNNLQSPLFISSGYSKFASIFRIIYSLLPFPFLWNYEFVFNPTHQCFFHTKKQIITIHDLICLDFPRQHQLQYLYFRYIARFFFNKGTTVITVSEFTKTKILNQFNFLDPERIHVLPNAIDCNLFHPAPDKSQVISLLKKPYLLVIGATYSHKNVHEILQYHESWKYEYDLHIVSSDSQYLRYLKSLINDLELTSSVSFFEGLELDLLVKEYQYASALIYPSLHEGFGIPPLEAMACMTPVIVPDISIFNETLGDQPLYFTSGDQKSFSKALLQIHKIISDKNELIKLRNYALNFSTEELDKKFISLIHKFIDENS